ncbi:hypothetical protein SUNI508_02281 [Seiridium unicorne]|uniref:Ankyrin n=1 Tax=Seiridium unicorne TaxID=138068 RepID=A0ABR2UHT2_9PEZI
MDKLAMETISNVARLCDLQPLASLCLTCRRYNSICEPVLLARHKERQSPSAALLAINRGRRQKDIVRALEKIITAKADLTETQEYEPGVIRPFFDFNRAFRETECQQGTPLHWAALKGHDDVVEFLLEYIAIDVSVNGGYTPLFAALHYGRDVVAMMLLERGAATVIESSHTSALHLAAARNCHHVIEYLIQDRGISVNILDENGYTPLHYTLNSPKGSLETLRLFYRHGAGLDCPIYYNYTYHTLLDIACERRRWDLARELVVLGAIVTKTHQNTPTRTRGSTLSEYPRWLLQLAFEAWPTPDRQDFIYCLLDQGVNPNEHVLLDDSEASWTGPILLRLILHDKMEDVKILLRHRSVDVHSPDSYGKTCLEYALSPDYHNPLAARLLLDQGAVISQIIIDQLVNVFESILQSGHGGTIQRILYENPHVAQCIHFLVLHCNVAKKNGAMKSFLQDHSRLMEWGTR